MLDATILKEMSREQIRSHMRMDGRLKLAIGFNMVLLLLILVLPNLPERYPFEIQIEPEIVPLGTKFDVKITFKEIPASCTLKIVDGATGREIESKEFSSISERDVVASFIADEEKYSIGLQVARVEANYGEKSVVRETYFPITTGCNISALIYAKPSILHLKPGENATVNLTVKVYDEFNQSVPDAVVWIWTNLTNASLYPNLSRTNMKGETYVILSLPPGNYTKVVVYVTVAKRGHPAFITHIEIPIFRKM